MPDTRPNVIPGRAVGRILFIGSESLVQHRTLNFAYGQCIRRLDQAVPQGFHEFEPFGNR